MALTQRPLPSAVAIPQVSARPRPGAYALLDAARGVACLWVVCHHALGFMLEGNPAMADNPVYTVGLNGALRVWIFFVISGYCIANTAASTLTSGRSGWVLARVRRIYPPCWFSSLLCIASALFAQWLVHRGTLKSSHLADFNVLGQATGFYLANFSLTQRLLHTQYLAGVYWTLCYELGFYTVVGVILYLNRFFKGSPRLMLNYLHGVTLLSLAVLIVSPQLAVYPFDLWPHFGLGVLLYDVLCHDWHRLRAAFIALILLGCGVFILQHAHRDSYLDQGGGIALLTAVITAVALLGLHRFDHALSARRAVRILSWVGVFSYSLYLTHMTLIGYVYKACLLVGLLPRSLPLYLLLALLVTVGFARLFFQFCERPFLSGKRTREVAVLANELRPETSLT